MFISEEATEQYFQNSQHQYGHSTITTTLIVEHYFSSTRAIEQFITFKNNTDTFTSIKIGKICTNTTKIVYKNNANKSK